MKKIIIKSIPYKEQRYPTCGDYWETDDSIEVRVNKINYKAEMLITIHELIESFLTRCASIEWENIDNFDREHEKKDPGSEPGDNVNAPYYKQHQIASAIENLLCMEIGLTLDDYENMIEDSYDNKSTT